MHTTKLDWCAIMENKFENKMWEQLIDLINDSAGEDVIHKCPYTVNLMKYFKEPFSIISNGAFIGIKC